MLLLNEDCTHIFYEKVNLRKLAICVHPIIVTIIIAIEENFLLAYLPSWFLSRLLGGKNIWVDRKKPLVHENYYILFWETLLTEFNIFCQEKYSYRKIFFLFIYQVDFYQDF